MNKKNSVFIATSIDGYIADKNGNIDWLHSIPNPNNNDMGYANFTNNIDALIMGRTTFETVLGFDVSWPCPIPLFVLSNKLIEIPETYKDKAFLINSSLKEVLNKIGEKGYNRLYIDGGTTIKGFLKEDLIDEMTITTIPILLGGGFSLFGDLDKSLEFELIESDIFLNHVVQKKYRRKK